MPGMRRVLTYFNLKDFAKLEAYVAKHKISLYALAKKAIKEFVERHP
jgi:hypothetical protein